MTRPDLGGRLERFGRRWGFFAQVLPVVAIMAALEVLWSCAISTTADYVQFSTLAGAYKNDATARIPRLLAGGRHEWMALILGGYTLVSLCTLVSLRTLARNLTRASFATVLLAGLLFGAAFVAVSSHQANETPIVFMLTEAIALPAYGESFAAMASAVTRVLFASTMIVSFIVLLAGASVLSPHHAGGSDNARCLEAKRRDLKLQLVLASVLLTHTTTFIGQWLKWPAGFIALAAKAAPKDDVCTQVLIDRADQAAQVKDACAQVLANGAEQVQAFAEGARLYFGAGYSLALAVAAIGMVLGLSRRWRVDSPETSTPEFLAQNVLTHSEVAALLGLIAPLLAGAIGMVAKV